MPFLRRILESLILLFSALLLIVGFAVPVLAAEDPPTFLMQWGGYGSGAGEVNMPYGVAVDPCGNVYVADWLNDRIQKFNRNGVFMTKWGSSGSGNGEFQRPMGVAVDSDGNIYVADTSNDRVQKFDGDGGYLTQWGSQGSGDGQFSVPAGVAVDADGNVYVADTFNDRVQKFDSDGVFQTKWGTGSNSLPYGVAADLDGNVYVCLCGFFTCSVQKYDNVGVLGMTLGTVGSGDGQFLAPLGVAVDADGNVYVADDANRRIQKFDSLGVFQTKWSTAVAGDAQSSAPFGVAVAPDGAIYVTDRANDSIKKYGYSVTFDIDLTVGWNMVSVPGDPADPSVSAAFPGVDAVYTWDPVSKSYKTPDTIEPGYGYWVAVSTGRTIAIEGLPVNGWSHVVLPGWNMIGSVCGGSCSFGNPSEVSGDHVESFVYCWDPVSKSYQYGTDICPCKGYWAAATDSCVLTVGPPGP